MKMTMTRRVVMAAAAATLAFGGSANAEAHQVLDQLHFIIPGGAGGGWDGAARGTGEALTESGLVGSASYENMSGGGGGVAIAYLIENAESLDNTLMVNSTPIVIRSLTGVFPQSFRDLTLVAGTIGRLRRARGSRRQRDRGHGRPAGCLFRAGHGLRHRWRLGARRHGSPCGGDGDARGGRRPDRGELHPYDAGGEAMAGLLSGEIDALSTGFSEAIALADAGEVRILGVTAPERVPAYDAAPTFVEQGIDTTFINWRGFFAPPGTSDEKVAEYVSALEALYETDAWEAVRSRNGWVNIWNPGDDFRTFLEAQEQEIGDLMRQLGFL
jgi:putative tricarboxylic transport membrane protein